MGTADNVALLSDMRSDSVPNIDAIPPIPDLDLEDEVINRSLSEPDLSKDDVSLIRRRNGNYYITTLIFHIPLFIQRNINEFTFVSALCLVSM